MEYLRNNMNFQNLYWKKQLKDLEKKQIMVSRQYGFRFEDNGLIRSSVKVVVYFSNALSNMGIILWNFGFREDKTEKQRHEQQQQRAEKNSKTIFTILTN